MLIIHHACTHSHEQFAYLCKFVWTFDLKIKDGHCTSKCTCKRYPITTKLRPAPPWSWKTRLDAPTMYTCTRGDMYALISLAYRLVLGCLMFKDLLRDLGRELWRDLDDDL